MTADPDQTLCLAQWIQCSVRPVPVALHEVTHRSAHITHDEASQARATIQLTQCGGCK